MQSIGILGSGTVGKTLASGFLQRGHVVTIGTRNPDKLAEWQADNPKARIGSFADTAKADVLVLAGKGSAAGEILEMAGADALKEKTVLDATNPIAETAPKNGVLHFFTSLEDSLMERLQANHPEAHFVKAFNSVGAHLMVDPQLGSKPSMFICGNNEAAKQEASRLIEAFGWEVEDMGSAEAARAIEPLCMLWCIPGFRENQWGHAFKLLKPGV